MSIKSNLLKTVKGIVCLSTMVLFINCPADKGPLEKFRIMWRTSPATTMVIGWTQNSAVADTRVYYGTTDAGSNYAAYPFSATVSRSTNLKGMDHHFSRLSGLTPDTNYYFVVRDADGEQSPRYWFKTAPSNRDSFTFISGGDSRSNRDIRQSANKMVSKLRALFVAFGGDYTVFSFDNEWVDWLDDWQLTISPDGRMTPIVATRGNHEPSDDDVHLIFDTPAANNVYRLSFGDEFLDLYTLNTEISVEGDQSTWLETTLSQNENTYWKMAQYHRTTRPHVSSKDDQAAQYSRWSVPFYQYGVNLVIESDSHTVKTTWPIFPTYDAGHDEGFKRDDANGTVYMGEGTWGAPLRAADDNKNWTRASDMFNQFKWAQVSEANITVRTIKYENVDSVGSVNDNQPFVAPSGIDIWNPASGSEVVVAPQ